MQATSEQLVADAIRKVTASVQKELESGRRSSRIDAYDVCEIMLSVADELDRE